MAGEVVDMRRRERLVEMCAELENGGSADAVSRLAAEFWDAPAAAMDEAFKYVPDRRTPVRTVGIYYCRHGIGGVERVNRDLILLWKSMGYRVVLIGDDGPGDDDIAVPQGVERAFVPSCFASDGESYAPRAKALWGVLERLKVDALVYAQWLGLTLPWDAMVARLQGVSFVVHTHGGYPCVMGFTEKDFTALPPCYALVDAVVCLSAADERFWKSYNVNVFRTVNTLSPCVAQAAPASLEGGNTVLWVGRIQAVKHPREALEVMARVVGQVPEARLVMVGPFIDADRALLEEAARELGLEGRVELVGPQTEKQMPQWYAQADVLLMTSHYEGYPLALQEAMGMGVPAVLYDMPYLTLCEGQRGVALAPMGDVDALARNVAAVLTDPELRREMGDEARAYVAELQGFDQVLLWREVFDVVASRKRLPPRVDALGPAMWRAVYDTLEEVKDRAVRDQADRMARLEARVAELEAHNERLQSELDATTGSMSFKAGRAFTAPFRMARDAFDRRAE